MVPSISVLIMKHVVCNRISNTLSRGGHLWNHYRAILSLLCSVKIMWFRDSTTGAQFGIRIPHGAFIVLTRFGSGAEGTICHMVTGADDSFIFVFDFGEKK
mmetsp:Transcript_12643/g.16150  ORF Transcript_12643/g.16150 Transcript_12643/m.16150 type:complete len:101 (+) Transcript_12643:304-606(+)